MAWYRVVLKVRSRASGLVSIVTTQDYAYSYDDAISQSVDYSIQRLLYDVIEVCSVTEIR